MCRPNNIIIGLINPPKSPWLRGIENGIEINTFPNIVSNLKIQYRDQPNTDTVSGHHCTQDTVKRGLCPSGCLMVAVEQFSDT